jgi:methylglutaconyl-CoA hydratase
MPAMEDRFNDDGRRMSYETIDIRIGRGVAVLWLNRPQVRNAFNETMIAELTAAFGELEADPAVRAVVLAGHGKVFCAGADLNWMKRMGEFSFDENRKDALAFGTMLNRLYALKKPTLARVHGAAFAGAMGLIAACDIAVASTDTEFCVSEVRLGLAPATISPYVLAAMGERAAQRYFLTAERFPAAEAYRIGFVQELAQPQELDATVNAILGQLVQGARGAQAATKELIHSVASSSCGAHRTKARRECARSWKSAPRPGSGNSNEPPKAPEPQREGVQKKRNRDRQDSGFPSRPLR